MTAGAYTLKDALAAFARGWRTVFHAPCDARVPALVRVAFAAVALANFAAYYPDLERWFTEDGVLSTAASQSIARPYVWSVLWWLPSTPVVVQACFWVAVTQTALLLVGCLSRVNAVCLFVWLVSFQNRNPLLLNGEDTVMRLLAFLLIWMPIGQCWSLDAWWWPRLRRVGLPEVVPTATSTAAPGWGLRLLQIQMCIIFLSAGLCKLGGDAWLDGTALYYVARLDDYFGRFPMPDWPFDNPWAVALFTWSVVTVELLVPVFIWFRETRRLCLLVLVLFHLANEWTMHLFLFHWAMLAGWLAFVQPADWLWLVSRQKELRS